MVWASAAVGDYLCNTQQQHQTQKISLFFGKKTNPKKKKLTSGNQYITYIYIWKTLLLYVDTILNTRILSCLLCFFFLRGGKKVINRLKDEKSRKEGIRHIAYFLFKVIINLEVFEVQSLCHIFFEYSYLRKRGRRKNKSMNLGRVGQQKKRSKNVLLLAKFKLCVFVSFQLIVLENKRKNKNDSWIG